MINHDFSFQKYNYMCVVLLSFLDALRPISLHLRVSIPNTSNLLSSQYDDKEVMIAIHSDVMLIIIIINHCSPNSFDYMF